MKTSEIEAWALQLVDQVKKQQPNEDSRVELKAEWPKDPYRTARQIAGHANANRGDNILWIIGLDENKGIIGADKNELANWLPQVMSYFNEVSPEVIDLNVPVENKTLVALLFSTERIPFVVKNKAYGKTGVGPVELEIPWREVCSTRTARRSDLIRILVPISHLPRIEFLGASINVFHRSEPDYEVRITAYLYIYPYQFQKLAIPCHRCELKGKIGDIEFSETEKIILKPLEDIRGSMSEPLIKCTKTEAIINGPGLLHLYADSVKLPTSTKLPSSDAILTVKFNLIDIDKPIIVSQNLKQISKPRNAEIVAAWSFGRQSF